MASSHSESEDSAESETDSEVDGDQIHLEPQKHDNLKKELEKEDRVSFLASRFRGNILQCGIYFLHLSQHLAFDLYVQYLYVYYC
jgi:hypothetical protein